MVWMRFGRRASAGGPDGPDVERAVRRRRAARRTEKARPSVESTGSGRVQGASVRGVESERSGTTLAAFASRWVSGARPKSDSIVAGTEA